MDTHKRLLKRQRTELIDCIRKRIYFDFSHFEYIEQNDAYIIIHKTQGFQFKVKTQGEMKMFSDNILPEYWTYDVVYFPGKTMQPETALTDEWKDVIRNFNYWLKVVYEETKGDDWWELIKSYNDLQSNFNFGDKRNFTAQEKINLKAEFEDVKLQAFEIANMTADELKIIKDEIDNLKEKIDLLNKPDFMKQVIGSVGGYIAKYVSEEVAKQVWQLLSEKLLLEFPLLK